MGTDPDSDRLADVILRRNHKANASRELLLVQSSQNGMRCWNSARRLHVIPYRVIFIRDA